MNRPTIAYQLKKLRQSKGFSQEDLAETSGLSLRTIQRIEANETIPRGDSLQKLSSALHVPMEELANTGLEDDPDTLKLLNFSALSFLVFPLLGIIVPLVIWISCKSRTRGAWQLGRSLINFQLTWVISLFGGYLIASIFLVRSMVSAADISPGNLSPDLYFILLFFGLMYGYNLFMLILNARRIQREMQVWYGPAIGFIR